MFNHIGRTVSKEIVQQRINALGIGQKMQDLPEELWHESFRFYVKEDKTRRGGPNLRMIRLDPQKPSLTVTGFIFNKFVHPFENRFITVREAARLQGFPDDMEILGSLTSTQKQIGNAVPVQLGEAVFGSILAHAAKINYQLHDLKAFSLFCGAGGLDVGASLANQVDYRIITSLAIDNWADACNTLRNYKGNVTNVLEQDICDVSSPTDFWFSNTKENQTPDIVYGGPPCQPFSQAGKQKALDDGRGQLVYQFLRYIEDLKPSFFVMENVSNIVSIYGGKLYKEIISIMKSYGYNVTFSVLNSADYGVPQLRRRAIFIGCKKEYGIVPLPEPEYNAKPNLLGLPMHKTVKDAFVGLPKLT